MANPIEPMSEAVMPPADAAWIYCAKRCSTICTTLHRVSRSLHVRLDDASAAALEVVRSSGMTDSEAVRAALQEAAARRRARSAIQQEVLALAQDRLDRQEMRVIREQMADLAPRPD